MSDLVRFSRDESHIMILDARRGDNGPIAAV